jgi:hypothetical protein
LPAGALASFARCREEGIEPSRAEAHGFLSSAALGLRRPVRCGFVALLQVRVRYAY